MICKSKKRSLYVRIAFVLFAVALAFCSVSVVLNEGKYKAEAASSSSVYVSPYIQISSDLFVTLWVSNGGSEVDTRATLVSEASSFYDCESDSSNYPSSLSESGYYILLNYIDSESSEGISNFEPFSVSYNFVPVTNAGLSEVLLMLGDSEATEFFSDGAYLFECKFYQFSDGADVSVRLYLPYNEYTSAFSLDQQSVTESVTDVWTSIFTWLTTSVNSLLGILYINGELTILGVLVVMSLGISIFFLLLAVVSNFFHLRS